MDYQFVSHVLGPTHTVNHNSDENGIHNVNLKTTSLKYALGSRSVLGNLTNRLQDTAVSILSDKNTSSGKVTAKTIAKKRNKLVECCDSSLNAKDICCYLNVIDQPNNIDDDGVSKSDQSHQSKTSDLSESVQPKRLRSDLINKINSDAQINLNADDSESTRRPFKSKLACDIVRAAFADRVQLEELLAECRRADFAVSALDRSPVDRMMEATDYIVRIMAYEQIRENKECFQVSDFLTLTKQPNLNSDMLTTLADWLVEVQENFALNHETIHLAWGLLYAYLTRGPPLSRREIQLMACAAIMVACKHEERQMPHLSEFLYITDNAYTKEEFIETERRLLIAIDFAVHRPNPYVFLRRYARVLDAHNGPVQFTSRFLLEAGMHSHVISLKRDSRKAAAVLWLARVVLRNPSYVEWTRRADVRQLRQLIRDNAHVHSFYTQCCKSVSDKEDLVRSRLDRLNVSANLSTSNVMHRSISITDSGIDSTSSTSCCDVSRLSIMSDTNPVLKSCHSIPNMAINSSGRLLTTDSNSFQDLDASIKADLEAMRLEEEQRQPLWPPILEHITGYKEVDLIPLAFRYHTIALRLIAEVARGGRLAEASRSSARSKKDVPTDLSVHGRNQCDDDLDDDEEEDEDAAAAAANPRCVSPGGHYLRRQSVTKYCSSSFLSVADAYPQLAFENFVPHFPTIQCPEGCQCFVCVNLVNPTKT